MKPKQIHYENKLNKEQLKIVNNLRGKMLILAGAGSGKTRTITYSVAKLIEMDVSPKQIMLVTFTNKASEEMLGRVKKLLGFMPSITAGTFHSIAHTVFLKRFKGMLKYGRYDILDESKARDLINKCIDDACRDELISNPQYLVIHPDKEDDLLQEIKKKFPKAKNIKEVLSSSANCNRDLAETIDWRFQEFKGFLSQIREINKRYKDIKKKFSKIDFDDLLILWSRLLDFESVKKFAKRYKYILVDEYQDTNFIQNEIITKLAKLNEKSCLMVVGDDAQSIYAFRGANIKNFLNFQTNFYGCTQYNITTNYRSIPEILYLANDSIKNNYFRYEKDMRSNRESGMKPLLFEAETFQEQINWLLENIIKLHQEGKPYGEIALLFRSLRGNREEIYYINKLMIKLTENKIPFEVRGGRSLFEKAHIRDLLAFLAFRYNPKDVFAEGYWKRIATKYIYGLGETNAIKIYEELIYKSKNPVSLLINKRELKARIIKLKQKGKISRLGDKTIDKIIVIMKTFYSFTGSVGMIINSFIKSPLFYNIFEEKYKRNENDESFQERLNDIDLLIEIGNDFKIIGKFLNDLSLNESEYHSEKKGNDRDKLIISTIHRAKGLEWENVFLPMLENGFFPSYQNLTIDEDLEEERRVFYVALTRAKTNLFLSRSRFSGRNDLLEASMYLEELDDNLYETLN